MNAPVPPCSEMLPHTAFNDFSELIESCSRVFIFPARAKAIFIPLPFPVSGFPTIHGPQVSRAQEGCVRLKRFLRIPLFFFLFSVLCPLNEKTAVRCRTAVLMFALCGAGASRPFWPRRSRRPTCSGSFRSIHPRGARCPWDCPHPRTSSRSGRRCRPWART